MNGLDSFYLKAMCQKHGGDYQVVMNYIEVFVDLLQDIHLNSPDIIVRTYTLEEARTPSFKIFFQYISHYPSIFAMRITKEDGSVQLTVNLGFY